MRISVVLLYITVTILTTVVVYFPTVALCPDKCQCSGRYPSTSRTVNCHGRSDVDVDRLTAQLDSFLSSNLTYGHLTSLSIVSSPLTHVPRSVCRLRTLTRLHLDNNRLTRLPDDCLTNLTALTQLSASRNNISQLQDGVFDGLQQLHFLELGSNSIRSIGLKVFKSSANLKRLRKVNLTSNKLRSLEPWPYLVGTNGSPGHRAQVELGNNEIRYFTNAMDITLKCEKSVYFGELGLQHNNIEHLSDLLDGWNITLMTLLCLSPYRNGPGSAVKLAGNFVHCDCVDFFIYKILYYISRAHLMDDTYCSDPYNLVNRRVNSVPVTQFVCDLPERCPPGCRCIHRPANATLHVYCSNSNLTALPLQLPVLPKSYTKYKLDLSNNRLLRRLEHRDYLVNTSILDVSNCGIETADNWKQLLTVSFIYLNGNRLKSLPQSIATVQFHTEHLALYNNSWQCYCRDKWLSNWLKNLRYSLVDPTQILCTSPRRLVYKSILHISDEEFCTDPVSKALTLGMSLLAGVVVILIFLGVIVYRQRLRLYTRWKFHPFDRDECLGEDMDYDVFLSCSSNDNLPHGNAIREQLEECGYRVCYPPRDFLGGETVHENICKAVVGSKRTVCFLTHNFVHSSYCMQEFDIALHHNIMVKRKKRLIVLMALDSPNDLYANDASDTATLRQYVRQYTYIDYPANDWLDKLLYALPLRGLLQPTRYHNDDDQLLADSHDSGPIAVNNRDAVALI